MDSSTTMVTPIAGGEHTLIHVQRVVQQVVEGDRQSLPSSSSKLWSAGACGLGWCRDHPLNSSLYRLRQVRITSDSDDDTTVSAAATTATAAAHNPSYSYSDTSFSQVYASYYHNLAVGAQTGKLYSWGCGTFTDGEGLSNDDDGDEDGGQGSTSSSSSSFSSTTTTSSLDGVKPALGQGAINVRDIGQGPRPVIGLEHLCFSKGTAQQQSQEEDNRNSSSSSNNNNNDNNNNRNDYIRQISGGAYHSIVLTNSGDIYTFGAGQLGQLGRPVQADVSPTTANTEGSDASGLPVDPTPRRVVGIPRTEFVSKIGSGFYNTFAICQKSGNLYCAGENQNKQCGNGLPSTNGNVGDSDNDSNHIKNLFTMTKVGEMDGQHVDQAEGGYCHTLIKTIAGKVYSMGCAEEGQRGIGRIKQDEEDDEEEEKNDDNDNYNNELLTSSVPVVSLVSIPDGQKATKISTGANHSLILTEDGTAYAFGCNDVGQCGTTVDSNSRPGLDDGNNVEKEVEGDPVWSPTKIRIPEVAGKVVHISAGYAHSVVSTEKGRVFVFGQNDNGQLGLGDDDADEPVRTPTELTLQT